MVVRALDDLEAVGVCAFQDEVNLERSVPGDEYVDGPRAGSWSMRRTIRLSI